MYDTVLEYLSPFDHFTDVMETDAGEPSGVDAGGSMAQPRYSVDVAV